MVRRLEKQGMTTSDAQSAADVHYSKKSHAKTKALVRAVDRDQNRKHKSYLEARETIDRARKG